MQQSVDPKSLFGAIHTQATGELMQLMDGFYFNIEDGLFELAYSNEDQVQQRRVVELMRELRFRRQHLLKTFGKRIKAAGQGWLSAGASTPEQIDEWLIAGEMSGKCAAHFGPVLQSIAERTANATERDVERRALPLSPEEVSFHFVMSCRSVQFDKYSIATVQSLFCRFVLDRLGGIYGRINSDLEDAGFYTMAELDELAVSTA